MTEKAKLDKYTKKGASEVPFYDRDQDACFVRRITTTSKFDLTSRKWRVLDRKTENIPLLEAKPELKKELKLKIIFKREATSTETLLPLQAFFIQELTFKVPQDAKNKHVFLVLVDGKIVKNDMKADYACILDESDPDFLVSKSEPQRISLTEAKKLQKKENLQVFTEIKGELHKHFLFKSGK